MNTKTLEKIKATGTGQEVKEKTVLTPDDVKKLNELYESDELRSLDTFSTLCGIFETPENDIVMGFRFYPERPIVWCLVKGFSDNISKEMRESMAKIEKKTPFNPNPPPPPPIPKD